MRSSKSIMTGVAVLAALALPMVAGAANKLVVNGTDGTTPKMVVSDGGFIGVGTSSPSNPFTIVGANTSAETTFELRHTGGGTYNRYTTPTARFMRNVSPDVNGGNLIALDRIGWFQFGTYFGTTPKYSAAIAVAADGNFSSSSFPGAISLMTASATDTGPIERLTVNSAGNVGLGTLVPKQRLEVNGGIRINTSATHPTCDANARGTFWYTKGGTLTADALEICFKAANDTYSWVKIQ